MRCILFIASVVFTLLSCEKTKLAQKDEVDPTGKALVKVGYFTPYSAATNVGVQLVVDGIRVSNTFTYAITYPGGGFNMGGQSNPDYLAVATGSRTLKVSIPKAGTNTDSIVLFTGPVTLAADSRQTVMLTDTGANTMATLVPDVVTAPVGDRTARAKFFNGIPNAGAIDLYIVPPTGVAYVAATNIDYKGVSPYFEFAAGQGSVTFQIVKTGLPNTTANIIASYVFGSSGFGRNYTILSRGYVLTPVSTTDIRRPFVSVIVNL